MQKFWEYLCIASAASVAILLFVLYTLPPGSPYETTLQWACLAAFLLFALSWLCVKRRRNDRDNGDRYDGVDGDGFVGDLDD